MLRFLGNIKIKNKKMEICQISFLKILKIRNRSFKGLSIGINQKVPSFHGKK